MTLHESHARDAILAALTALACNVEAADGLGRFVDDRAQLLDQLDKVTEPWTDAQRAKLQEALQAGAQALILAQAQRNKLARKIDALKAARGAAKHTAAYVAPSWRKTV